MASKIKVALEKANIRTMELFRDWDADQNGSIDRKEFQTSMLALGIKATKEQLDGVFDRWDSDGNGAIDYDEFTKILLAERTTRFAPVSGGGGFLGVSPA